MAHRLPAERVFTVAGEHPSTRLLRCQDVRRGSLRGGSAPSPLQVAAVLHGLADHTHLAHIVDVVVSQAALADPGDDFNPPATSLGRYFHALADQIERDVSTSQEGEPAAWPRCPHGYGPGDHHYERGECHDAPTAANQVPAIDAQFLARQYAFSQATFGPGLRTNGVTKHIEKELVEVREAPSDIGEWIDIVLLGLDGAMRVAQDPRVVLEAVRARLERNERRQWPDWRDFGQDDPIEHVRGDAEPTAEPASTPSRADRTACE